VREVLSSTGAKRFDPNAHIEHHHLQCRGCGQLWDHPASTTKTDRSSEAIVAGFVVEHTDVTYVGLCATCG
jgi:Fur family ferric uptake transcriptional regulator